MTRTFTEDTIEYEKFTKTCKDNGVKIGFAINKLIKLYNTNPSILN